jgi:hypothetical protein
MLEFIQSITDGCVENGDFECITSPSWTFEDSPDFPVTYKIVTASDCTNLSHSGAKWILSEF